MRGVSEDGNTPSSGDFGDGGGVELTVLDAKAVHAGADLVAAVDLRVLRRQGVEVRPIPASQITHADGAVGIGTDFEMAAGEKLVGHAHVSFATHHETARRDFELLPVQRTADCWSA